MFNERPFCDPTHNKMFNNYGKQEKGCSNISKQPSTEAPKELDTRLGGDGIPVVVGGEDAVDVGADLAGRLENLLRLHRVNGRRLLGALVHDSWNEKKTDSNQELITSNKSLKE